MSKKANVLPDSVRDEIVMRLAMYDAVKDIHADLVERGYDVSHQAVSKYNPYNANGHRAPKRKALFDKTREDFLNEVTSVPIASKTYRLRKLNTIVDTAMKRGAFAIAQSALEQAAKEVGQVYTKANTAALAVAVPVDSASLDGFDADEKRNMLADRLGQVIGRGLGNQATKH